MLISEPAKRPTRLILCDLTARTIRHGLEKLGESYSWLAKSVGVSKTSIGYYARGEYMPNDEIRRKIILQELGC